MGGIAGILSAERGRVDPALLEAMLLAIAHRGPGDSGLFHDDRAALGYVRSAAISRPPSQPLQEGRSWIVFDGQLVNAGELRKELHKCGRSPRGPEDADLVLAAYEIFGEDCVRRFDGAWAFGIWDAAHQALFASRDRFGIRPFFYTTIQKDFVFGSEIKALVQHPALDRKIDVVALDQIFTLQAAIPPRTILHNVFELPPGHSLYWSEGALRVFRHWQLDFGVERFTGSEQEAEERLFELLSHAARETAVHGTATGALADGLSAELVAEFARRFGEKGPAVLSLACADSGAAEPAHGGNGTASRLQFAPAEIGSVFAEMVWHAEAPLLGLQASPIFLAARAARRSGCDTLVMEAGADELFGGSEIFAEAAIRRFWGRQVDSQYRPLLLKRLYPDLPWQASQPLPYWQAFFHVRGGELSNPLFSHLARWGQTARLKKYFSGDLLAEIGEYDALEEVRLRLPAGFKHWDSLSQAQFLETSWSLSSSWLSRLDRMAMAHGLATRMPFLDRPLAEFAVTLPGRLKLRGVRGLPLLWRMARRLFPDDFAADRASLPDVTACLFGMHQAATHEQFDALLGHESLGQTGLFDPLAVSRLVQKARRGETVSTADQTALLGILSTQIVADRLLRKATVDSGQWTVEKGGAGGLVHLSSGRDN